MPFHAPRIRLPDRLNPKLEVSAEDESRRSYLARCLLFIIPAVSAFAVADAIQGRLSEALITFVVAAFMAITVVLLPRWQKTWILFRSALLVAVTLVCYQMATGRSGGFAFLWIYALPVVAFFLFGAREGLAWVLTSSAVLFALFFGELGLQPYDFSVGIRFLTTYSIVSALAYGLEVSRRRYYEELLAEKTSMEHTLAQVKILSGLLPICVSCKSVRDDRGYWTRIEAYIGRHSQAELRGSLCPDCVENSTAGLNA